MSVVAALAPLVITSCYAGTLQNFLLGDRSFSIPSPVAQGQVLLHALPVCSVENHRRRILLAAIHFWLRGPLPSLDMPSPFFRCCGARGPYLWTIGSDGICISTSTLQQVI